MRFFAILAAFGLVAFTSAQVSADNATEVASSTSASAPAATSMSSVTICLQQCGSANICCQAACVNVPCPSQLQANATTECAAQCPQGDGSAEDTQNYASCQSSCISSLFFSTTGATAATTGAGASATGSAATTTADGSGIGDGSSTASETGSAATSSSTSDNAGSSVRVGAAGVGLIGLFIAGLAL